MKCPLHQDCGIGQRPVCPNNVQGCPFNMSQFPAVKLKDLKNRLNQIERDRSYLVATGA